MSLLVKYHIILAVLYFPIASSLFMQIMKPLRVMINLLKETSHTSDFH